MKKLALIFLGLCVVGCSDTDRASFAAIGNPGTVVCFSGGELIYSGRSTGVIQTVQNSDGWEFKEEGSGKLVRISGTCIIKN